MRELIDQILKASEEVARLLSEENKFYATRKIEAARKAGTLTAARKAGSDILRMSLAQDEEPIPDWSEIRKLSNPNPVSEEGPFPSFFAIHGRKPIAGKDFDPEVGLCQDDYEYFSGTGRYSDEAKIK